MRRDAGTTKNKQGRHINNANNSAMAVLFETQWQEHEALRKAGTICRYVVHRNGKRIKDFRGAWKAACTTSGARRYATWFAQACPIRWR